MAIERRLTEIVGPLGGKLHTGRSRNDQVATDLALYVREHAALARAAGRRADGAPARARRAPRRLADARLHAPAARPARVPGAPPARLLLDAAARREPVRRRSAKPPASCRSAPARSPASTGTSIARRWPASWASTRCRPTRSTRSRTATSCSTTSPRRRSARCTCRASAREIVLWSSDEFGFCELAEDFSSGSSIMPQKKNPDAAELLRAKAPRIAAGFLTLAGVMHGLPLAYSKDLQEDKEALFDAVDTLELCLEAAERMLGGPELRPRAARRGGRRRDPGRDRHRRPAGSQGDAVPGGPRRGRRAGARGARSGQGAVRADARRTWAATRSCSTTPTTRCCARASGSSRRSRRAAPRRRGSPSSSTRPGSPSRTSGDEHAAGRSGPA